MIEQSVSLASNGVVKVPGYEQLVRFGSVSYTHLDVYKRQTKYLTIKLQNKR